MIHSDPALEAWSTEQWQGQSDVVETKKELGMPFWTNRIDNGTKISMMMKQ